MVIQPLLTFYTYHVIEVAFTLKTKAYMKTNYCCPRTSLQVSII